MKTTCFVGWIAAIIHWDVICKLNTIKIVFSLLFHKKTTNLLKL